MSDTRIPDNIAGFNTYIANTAARLVAINPVTTNPFWQDFTLTNAEQTEWAARRTTWVLTLFPTYANPGTSTGPVKEQVENFMNSFKAFAQPLLNKIVASGMAVELDAAIFNVVLQRAEPTHHTTTIPDDCIASIKLKGRGMLDIHCKSTEDQTRASIPVDSGANSLQYSYVIGGQGINPFDPDDTHTIKGISTKAHFTLNLGAPAQGQWLYIYFRWYNIHNSAIAGAWSEMHVVAIG